MRCFLLGAVWSSASPDLQDGARPRAARRERHEGRPGIASRVIAISLGKYRVIVIATEYVKLSGNKRRRHAFKDDLRKNPAEAALSEETFGRHSSASLNGADNDSTRRQVDKTD